MAKTSFEAEAHGRYLGVDATATDLFIHVCLDAEDEGVAIVLQADTARQLRRFLDEAYPADQDPASGGEG